MKHPLTMCFAYTVASFLVSVGVINRKHACCGASQQAEEAMFSSRTVLTQNFPNASAVFSKQVNNLEKNLAREPSAIDHNRTRSILSPGKNSSAQGFPLADGTVSNNRAHVPVSVEKVVHDKDKTHETVQGSDNSQGSDNNQTNPLPSARTTKLQGYPNVRIAGRTILRNRTVMPRSHEDELVQTTDISAKDKSTPVRDTLVDDGDNLSKDKNNADQDSFDNRPQEKDTFPHVLLERVLQSGERAERNGTSFRSSSSSRCMMDFAASRLALISSKASWAQAMADSNGHAGSGAMNMEIDLVGVEGQCLGAQVPEHLEFQTQYCVIVFELSKIHISEAMKYTLPTGLSAGACMPDSCEKADIRTLADQYLGKGQGILGGIKAKDIFCKKEGGSLAGPGAIATLVMLTLWCLAVVVATIFDCWKDGSEEETLTQQPPQPEDNQRQEQHSFTSSSSPPRSLASSSHNRGQSQTVSVADASREQERDAAAESALDVERLMETDIDSDIVTIPEIQPQPTSYQSAKKLPLGKRVRYIRGILRGQLSDNTLLKSDEVSRQTMELNRLRRLARCLSLKPNADKLFDTSTSKREIGCLHGIRVISLGWIVLINTIVYETLFARNAFHTFKEWERYGSQYAFLAKGNLSLDSLFAISGLLTGYTYSMKLSKQWGRMNWRVYLFNRYWRIVPTMVFVGLIYFGLFAYVTGGPLAVARAPDQEACAKWGWLHLLLLQNFSPAPCVSWTWYLAVDFQLFLLTPFILWLLYRDPRIAYLAVFILVFASCIASGALTRVYGLTVTQFNLPDFDNLTSISNAFDALDYTTVLMYKPWGHAGAYLPPLLIGYLLYRSNRRASFGTRALVAGWVGAAAVPLAIMIGVRSELTHAGTFSPGTVAFYNAVHRVAWGLCVGWTVLACSTGHGGPVNSFLAWPGWKPLSRLVFVAYLIHPAVAQVYVSSAEQLMYATNGVSFYLYIGVLVCSLLLSVLISLVVEMPLAALYLWMSSSWWPGHSN